MTATASDLDLHPAHQVPDGFPPEEWAVRCDLAAAYRLSALYGWTDLNNTHISARVPGTEDEFLLNPFGPLLEEITASSLIRVDRHGNVVSGSDFGMNKAGSSSTARSTSTARTCTT